MAPMKMVTLSSMSSKRSPAAPRMIWTFWAVSSAVPVFTTSGPTSPALRSKLIEMMSASRAANANILGAPAPIRIGGCGCCTGLGVPVRSLIV